MFGQGVGKITAATATVGGKLKRKVLREPVSVALNGKMLIHKAEEGGYWAEVPALPGCVSQGETVDDVRSNVREAIEGWLLAEAK